MRRLALAVVVTAVAGGFVVASGSESVTASMPFFGSGSAGNGAEGVGSGADTDEGAQAGRLDASVERAFLKAQAAAEADGLELTITSGWRSRERQQVLYEEAIAKYGSPEIARQWVLPPDESAHVSGGAIDVGPESGAAWLQTNGVRYGLCQRYANEAWHFELLAAALGSDCPPLEPHA